LFPINPGGSDFFAGLGAGGGGSLALAATGTIINDSTTPR
jgi:hypothetical protein